MKAVLKTKCGCLKIVDVNDNAMKWLVSLKTHPMNMQEFTIADRNLTREFRRTVQTETVDGKVYPVFEET